MLMLPVAKSVANPQVYIDVGKWVITLFVRLTNTNQKVNCGVTKNNDNIFVCPS